MKLPEWIKYHDEKAKQRCNIPEGSERFHPASPFLQSSLVVDEKNGVFQYAVVGDSLFITGIIGSFAELEPKIIKIAKDKRCKKIVAYSPILKPKTLERLFKLKMTRIWYEFEREVM